MKKNTEEAAHIQRSANGPKNELMRLASKMEALSPKKAESLNRIIARLEAWQNR